MRFCSIGAFLLMACSATEPQPRVDVSGTVATAVRSAPSAVPPSSVALAPTATPTPKTTVTPTSSSSAVPPESPPVRLSIAAHADSTTSGKQRMDRAKQTKTDIVRGLFETAGVAWPPRQLLMRAFKKENRLEIWAAPKPQGELTHVTTYEICYASGELGPKRREGDSQVPEGFYGIVWFKPKIDFHMSMQVSYPNTSDRILGDKKTPGGEIMIHGNCVSIGCLAMSDERIEEIWVIARALPRNAIDVHIFPTRDMQGLLDRSSDSPHRAFWTNLKEGFDRFNAKPVRFHVRHNADGSYRFADR